MLLASLLGKIHEDFEANESITIIMCDLSTAFTVYRSSAQYSAGAFLSAAGGSPSFPRTWMREPRLYPWEEEVRALVISSCSSAGIIFGPNPHPRCNHQHQWISGWEQSAFCRLLGRGKTSAVAEEIAVELLKSSGRWFRSNRLRLNRDKTQRPRGYCVLKAAPRLPTTAV